MKWMLVIMPIALALGSTPYAAAQSGGTSIRCPYGDWETTCSDPNECDRLLQNHICSIHGCVRASKFPYYAAFSGALFGGVLGAVIDTAVDVKNIVKGA